MAWRDELIHSVYKIEKDVEAIKKKLNAEEYYRISLIKLYSLDYYDGSEYHKYIDCWWKNHDYNNKLEIKIFDGTSNLELVRFLRYLVNLGYVIQKSDVFTSGFTMVKQD